ncbi:MAG: DNA polymerase III subunit gamma/tau, partial [Gammaproteobacteria bacterium]|nr:DNA polymerase III subunit gamma/tau [Gammaproteobacteria bacterium]
PVNFLLATTDPQKLPGTVLSRCLQFNLRRLNAGEIKDHLASVLDADGVSYEPTALALLARAADGSVRDSLSLLDQALNFGAGKLAEAETRAMLGTVDESRVVALLASIVNGDAAATFEKIDELQSFGFDWKASLAELALICQRSAVYQKAPKALPDDTPALESIQSFAEQINEADLQLYYQIAVAGLRDMDLAPEPRAGFEMVMLRMLAFQPAAEVAVQPAPAQKKTEVSVPAVEAQPPQTVEPPVIDTAPAEAVKPAPEPVAQQVTDTLADEVPVAPAVPELTNQPVAQLEPSPEPSVVAETPQAAPPVVQQPEAVAPVKDISQLDWAVFAASLPLKGMLVALAENTTILQRDAGRLVLGVSAAMAAVCPEGVRQRFAEMVQERLLGIEVELTVLAENDQAMASTPAAKAAKAEEDRQHSAEDSIQRDPNVQQLVTEFDGRVEPNSIKPVSA